VAASNSYLKFARSPSSLYSISCVWGQLARNCATSHAPVLSFVFSNLRSSRCLCAFQATCSYAYLNHFRPAPLKLTGFLPLDLSFLSLLVLAIPLGIWVSCLHRIRTRAAQSQKLLFSLQCVEQHLSVRLLNKRANSFARFQNSNFDFCSSRSYRCKLISVRLLTFRGNDLHRPILGLHQSRNWTGA